MKVDGKDIKVPEYLKHKPIYEINDYDRVDGLHKNNTDAVGMSLGKAQWSDGEFEPSVKVWRYVKSDNGKYRWSRQSEETTLTRALDMAVFVIKIVDAYANGKRVDENLYSSIFGGLKINYSGNDLLLEQLKNYFGCENNINDIKLHIDILKNAIEEFYK